MEKEGFYTPLHLRSSFSLLRGVLSPEELCGRAAFLGWKTVGLADINNFYGAVRFIRAAKLRGQKPVLGVAVESAGRYLFTAICKNRRGYASANRLITALLDDPAYDPLPELCANGWEGLAILSPLKRVLSRLMETEKKDLYMALVFGRPFRRAAAWAKGTGLPCIAVNYGAYVSEEDRKLYRLLRAVDKNTTVDALPPEESFFELHRIASSFEMLHFFSALPEALRRGAELAEECSDRLLPETFVFPAFRGMSESGAFSRLEFLCNAGTARRYGVMRPDIKERLDYELSIIRKKRFASYFLVVHDIVSRCPRTCGRGSSAASIVSYLLGITHVDPLAHNLFFERFLNMGREDPPDIDVDFPWDERDKALAYVFSTYSGRAGMVADHVTFGPRSCLREPAKAFGLEEKEIAKLVECARFGEIEKIPSYLRAAASRLRGMPRHIGTHPGGVVITPGRITEYTHLQMSKTGFPVIAWEKDGAEDAGLVKIDILGNRSLGVLRDTIELVNKKRSSPVTWESFQPLDDWATRKLIEAGDTLGVFYVESPATRQLLGKMNRGDFEHLVIASSIIRPAANRYINLFVARLRGEPYVPIHPLVAEPLRETLGVMVYQEDVARVAIAAAGFSPAEADGLRKALSKKDRESRIRSYRKRFFSGGRKRGIGPAALEKLWDMVLSFDGYSFCKAHSASYALLSYRLAWMKRYYPLDFFTSVINNGGGFYSGQVYLNEVRRLGFAVLRPDINRSEWRHTVEDGSFRLGLCQIREVPETFLRGLLSEREKNGPFADLYDFLSRTDPGLPSVRNIIRSGCLDELGGGLTRPELFWAFFHRNGGDFLFAFPPVPKCIGDYSRPRKLYDEVDTLGLIVSCHPLEIFAEQRPLGSYIDSRAIPAHVGGRVAIAGVLITGKETKTKKREQMGFFSFDDPFGVFETVLFPDLYGELLKTLERGRAFLVQGKVAVEFDAYIIEIHNLVPLAALQSA